MLKVTENLCFIYKLIFILGIIAIWNDQLLNDSKM